MNHNKKKNDKKYKKKYFKYKSKYLDYKNFRNILKGGKKITIHGWVNKSDLLELNMNQIKNN